jgi:hypothetical protein
MNHMKKKYYYIIGAVVLVAGGVLVYFLLRPNLKDQIVIPYIAHQKPAIDPHLPSSNQLSDKLDEVEFDGLFDVMATPSGVVYEDGLGELVSIDKNYVVTVRLKTNKLWHDSYAVTVDDDKVSINKARDHFFSASDLNFTLKRIQSLGSLSPDYILVSQALKSFEFDGPNENGEIRFNFKEDRIWKDSDIKEVLTFKILPGNSEMNAVNYLVGSTPYMAVPQKTGVPNFHKTPDGGAFMTNVKLAPFIDNSTFTTELKNGSINTLLETPFGSLSPILSDTEKYFYKSNISTTFFAILFNTERLSLEQRKEVRRLINNTAVLKRFFKVNSPQQRQITDYKGNKNNYPDYINNSVFPSSSYYVEEKIVTPVHDDTAANLSVLPPMVNIKVCENYGNREEYEEFMREPDLETYRINLVTAPDEKGLQAVSPTTWQTRNNFFSLSARTQSGDSSDVTVLLHDIYGFMATHEIGDKQAYSERIDRLENKMCLGVWLFSLPSLAYFSTQLDSTSVHLYGVASQLSTIKKWKESAAR